MPSELSGFWRLMSAAQSFTALRKAEISTTSILKTFVSPLALAILKKLCRYGNEQLPQFSFRENCIYLAFQNTKRF